MVTLFLWSWWLWLSLCDPDSLCITVTYFPSLFSLNFPPLFSCFFSSPLFFFGFFRGTQCGVGGARQVVWLDLCIYWSLPWFIRVTRHSPQITTVLIRIWVENFSKFCSTRSSHPVTVTFEGGKSKKENKVSISRHNVVSFFLGWRTPNLITGLMKLLGMGGSKNA